VTIVPRREVTKSGIEGFSGPLAGGASLLVAFRNQQHSRYRRHRRGGSSPVIGFSLTTSRSDRTAGVNHCRCGVVTAAAALIPGLRFLVWLRASASSERGFTCFSSLPGYEIKVLTYRYSQWLS